MLYALNINTQINKQIEINRYTHRYVCVCVICMYMHIYICIFIHVCHFVLVKDSECLSDLGLCSDARPGLLAADGKHSHIRGTSLVQKVGHACERNDICPQLLHLLNLLHSMGQLLPPGTAASSSDISGFPQLNFTCLHVTRVL